MKKYSSESIENIVKIGIYSISHICKKDKVYIGSAGKNLGNKQLSQGFNLRWLCHISQLRNKKHHSIKLQRIVDKYGMDGLEFKIIEFCNAELIESREQYWMNKLQAYEKGYNCTKHAVVIPKRKRVKTELKKKQYTILTAAQNKKNTRIKQYTLDGIFIKEWKSVSHAAKELKICNSTIGRCSSGKGQSAGGFKWVRVEPIVRRT